MIPIDESLDEDIVSFFDAYGNATHTALMFDMVGEDVLGREITADGESVFPSKDVPAKTHVRFKNEI